VVDISNFIKLSPAIAISGIIVATLKFSFYVLKANGINPAAALKIT
jgi:hypothetical protein